MKVQVAHHYPAPPAWIRSGKDRRRRTVTLQQRDHQWALPAPSRSLVLMQEGFPGPGLKGIDLNHAYQMLSP